LQLIALGDFMKEFKCRDTGRDCDWKVRAESDDEVLKQAAQHGQQEHGTKDFVEDVREGLKAKIRDVKSSQIRG
jgi:predicted small metal-binding protein